MGKAGRICCISIPYLLTIASLICMIILACGCTTSGSSTLTDLYLFRVNMQHITTAPKMKQELEKLLPDDASNVAAKVGGAADEEAMQEVKKLIGIKDFYSVGLLGYCDGDVKGKSYDTTWCSQPKAEFYFNPVQAWGLDQATNGNSTQIEEMLPKDMQKDLNSYRIASKYLFIGWCIAIVATGLELLLGVFAFFSRWGSCITYMMEAIASLFLVSAVVVSTVLSVIVSHYITNNSKDYGISAEIGPRFQAVGYLAVAFHLAAGLFWLFTICCCGGKARPHRITAEKTPYTYEQLGPDNNKGLAQQGSSVQMHDMRHSAYEPFRQV